MIDISKNIIINAQQSIVWAFISDLPVLLTVNRFRNKVCMPSNYNLNDFITFKITNNFGLGNIDMSAKVVNSKAPVLIVIKEWTDIPNKISYQHETEYFINCLGDKSSLIINQRGSFGTKVQDISFKPIVSGIVQDELFRIKKYIESSETSSDHNHKNVLRPIKI